MFRCSRGSCQKLDWFNAQTLGDPLDALQGRVPLTPLKPTHVGPVDLQSVRKPLLAHPASSPVLPQVHPQSTLKIASCHEITILGLLLISPQTDE